MASLPPQPQRPTSQRRSSPPAESSSSQQGQSARTNSFSAQSVDSQTLLLNSPSRQSSEPAVDIPQPEQAQKQTQQDEDDEPRKCWICFNDETEDDETSSEWRSPCACSLVAHERCLLDWIADMEAPSSRRKAGTRAGKVLCPQCKSEIVIQRPKNYVVEGVRVVERFTGALLLPSLALLTGTALYSTLTVAGTHTIYQIFGTEDALHILGPLYETPNPRATSLAMQTLEHLRQHWRLDLGLPLIPTILVASRTTFADSFLPFLPLIFFVSSDQPGDELLQLQWPPSAAFTFAALPYIRGFYNAYYERIWWPREQRWLKEIQPRAGEDGADGPNPADQEQEHNNNGVNDAEDNIEIEVDFDIFADWNNGGEAGNHNAVENPPVPIARGPARPNDAAPADGDALPDLIPVEPAGQGNQQHAAPAPNVPQEPAAPRRQRVRRERNIAFSTTSLADTILGALIFPSIAAAVGELLRHTLPTSWVTPPSGTPAASWLGGWIKTTSGKAGAAGKPTGFLQTRWGRSIVGGCLFVGFKDAVLLYVRWKMAQNHRRRKIMDFDRTKAKKKPGTSAAAGPASR